jgi:hypothetical protein
MVNIGLISSSLSLRRPNEKLGAKLIVELAQNGIAVVSCITPHKNTPTVNYNKSVDEEVETTNDEASMTRSGD